MADTETHHARTIRALGDAMAIMGAKLDTMNGHLTAALDRLHAIDAAATVNQLTPEEATDEPKHA